MDPLGRSRARPALTGAAFRFLPGFLFPCLLLAAPAGPVPAPRGLSATYAFGWSALDAATAELTIRPARGRTDFHGKVATAGLVRTLWKLDGTLQSSLRSPSLLPINSRITERYRSETRVTDLLFQDDRVLRRRVERPGPPAPTEKIFRVEKATDLFGAVMHVRSQRLVNGRSYELLVFAKDSPYRARVTVEGREVLAVAAGVYPAIRLSLQLQKVDKKGRLLPAERFKKATAWFSDDAHRLLLRVESEVFVGSVWAELQRVDLPR